MTGRFLVAACAACAIVSGTVTPTPSHAQSASSVFGGLAGGVLGGMIAGSIAAQAARQRPVVVYAPRRTVRVVHDVRRSRRREQNGQPATGASDAQVVNAAADPFASARGNSTTSVNQTR